MIGKDDYQMGWREQADLYRTDDREVMQTGQAKLVYEEPQTTPEGERWVQTSKVPLKDSKGKIIGMLGAYEDITTRRQAEEQIRYQANLLQNVSDAIIATDENKLITLWNPAAEAMYGWKSDEVVGKNFHDIISPEYRYDSRETVFEKLSNVGTWSGEIVHHLKDRKPLTVLSTLSVLNDASGKKSGLVSINHDITEQKQIEEELQKSEEKYRLLVEDAFEGVEITQNDRIVFANTQFAEILGYSATEIASVPFTKIFTKQGLEDLYERQKDRQSGKPMSNQYETTFLKKDGTVIDVEVRYRIINYAGNPATFAVIRDITERKRAEEALKKSEEHLRQAQKMEVLGQLAGGIAHDFNNILAIIMGHSQLMKMGQQTPERATHSIDTIEKTSKRGADLVKQLMTIARKSEPLIAPVNLNDLISDTVKMLKETFSKVIVFETDIQLSLPFVLADASQMHQVLMNLCVNARDAMPEGGILRIADKCESGESIRQRRTDATADQYIKITVSDTGVGMDRATIDRIFEPFFTTKQLGKGTGLGLSTVHSIVSSHNGFIDVESKVGVGTTISVYLPASLSSETINSQNTAGFSDIKGGSETVLVIEDEEMISEMLKLVLSGHGYNVLTAKDGIEGVEIYAREKEKIALVLTDMGLPKLMGNAVFHRIRQINPKAKVILASGFLSPDDKSELYKSGLARFIQKPFMPIDVLKNVRKVLDSKS
ncbi:MAG: hybrid sensor histidine kinase/response regulator [Candidatus Marinimicrobia bacterium CG08_land_8_20_14_0_20_45_22]|nr:MAG: hybrid sensor histidine kinase/response regulator [Candidatus Marinimicrobia bacterium CG08_land_8_20_14_0_20_45_22]